MNCRDWEEPIALHVGCDLPAAQAAEVERHLGECAACREFAEGLKQVLTGLREAHGERIAPAHFAAVRARVLAELEGARRPLWRRWWIYAAVAAGALAIVLAIPRPAPAPQLPVAWIHTPPPPVLKPAPGVARVLPARHVRRRPRRAAAVQPKSPPAEPLLVRLVSDDPNVIIYWIADPKGD